MSRRTWRACLHKSVGNRTYRGMAVAAAGLARLGLDSRHCRTPGEGPTVRAHAGRRDYEDAPVRCVSGGVRTSVRRDLDPIPLQPGVELEAGEAEEGSGPGLVAVRALEGV